MLTVIYRKDKRDPTVWHRGLVQYSVGNFNEKEHEGECIHTNN